MTLWLQLKASHIISVPTRTCHLSSETLECAPVLPHPADPRTRTHAPTGSQMQLFHHFFLPPHSLSLSLPHSAAPIDLDRAQTKGGNADSYSQRLIQGTRRASPTGLPPPHRDVSWRRNLTFSSLERAKLRSCRAHSWHAAAFPPCRKSSKRNEEAFRKRWTFPAAVDQEGKRSRQPSWEILLTATLMFACGRERTDELEHSGIFLLLQFEKNTLITGLKCYLLRCFGIFVNV